MSQQELKALCRKDLKRKLNRLSARQRRAKTLEIHRKVLKNLHFQEAKHILFYAAINNEVATRKLISQALKQKKRVYLPKVLRKRRMIAIYEILSLRKDLIRGYQGIAEPRALKKRKATLRRMDVVLVPGLGFTRKGARLGRGGGYYDRLLSKSTRTYKLGVVFKEQILKKLPSAKHDIKVHKVITD